MMNLDTTNNNRDDSSNNNSSYSDNIASKNNAQDDDDGGLETEVRTRFVLHWNYRGWDLVPWQLLAHGGSHVEEVYLKENRLSRLPGDIGTRLGSLRELYLFGNAVSDVVPLAKCSNLEVLDLGRNRVAMLPGEIGEMKRLTLLDLRENMIEKLPDEIGNLTSLKTLNLLRNRIMSVSVTIGRLSNLETLYLSGNLLVSVPRSMGRCRGLKRLHLDENLFESVPDFVTCLPVLERLSVSRNPSLASLPFRDFEAAKKVSITFDGCPELSYIPYSLGQTLNRDKKRRAGRWRLNCRGSLVPNGSDNFGGLNLNLNQNLNHNGRLFLKVQLLDKHNLLRNFDLAMHPRLTGMTLMKAGNPGTIFEGTRIQTLRELSLRAAYKIITSNKGRRRKGGSIRLPPNIDYIVSHGPVSFCLSCKKPVFTHANAVVVAVDLERYDDDTAASDLIPSVALFCSEKCSATDDKDEGGLVGLLSERIVRSEIVVVE